MKSLILVLLAALSLPVFASQDLNNEMDALGANKALMLKAKALDPENRTRIVENREVDRTYRLELSVNYGGYAAGGDPYVLTSTFGGQADFHLNPHWSLGARYQTYNNTLTNEGKNVYNDANQRIENGEQGVRVPGIAYANNSWAGVVDFYPVYGKLNLFDASIAQFDLYVLGGAGQITLDTGTSPLYTAGAGIGVWLSKHFTTRLEARWQGYHENVWDGGEYIARNMNETILQASVGFLL